MENLERLEFLKEKLIFLENKLKYFEVAYLQILIECVENKYSNLVYAESVFYPMCRDGIDMKAHIDFIKNCIDLTKTKIKEINNV